MAETTKIEWTDGAAILSDCGLYRYQLERRVGIFDKQATFIMLNPSTADAQKDDPTIRRCIGFARGWQCGRLVVVNLFAYRATKPEMLKITADPIGPDNDRHILRAAEEASTSGGKIVCAWGAHGRYRDRDKAALAMLARLPVEPVSLSETAKGDPGHPLYLRGDCKPLPYRGRG